MPPILWQPDPDQIDRSNMTAFMRAAEERWHVSLPDYPALYQWSIDRPDQFWESVWTFCGVVAERSWDSVLTDSERMPGAKWFNGARLNFAENLLRFRDDRPALISWNERGRQREISYAELYEAVSRVAAAMRAAGVVSGDRVVGWIPNIPEAVIAMLAATSIGAVWSSCSPDFGINGVHDRFGQITPKMLFAVDGYVYNGREYGQLDQLQDVVERIDSIERVVVVPCISSNISLDGISNAVFWEEFSASAPSAEMQFEQLPFNHPLYILYSSGTTGAPKCIVHGAGGTLVQHLKEMVLHGDLRPDDRFFYFTTCGWMVWNWLLSSLAVGTTVVLYDGLPLYDEGRILFDMAEQERITVFGTSPKFLGTIEKMGLRPAETHRLDALRLILSTGSPLAAESFDYVSEHIKPGVQLCSIVGGTDLISCFAAGNPILPVYRGELQCRGLGMNVQIFDDDGQPVQDEKGELVCVAPFPSMPVYFWDDPDNEKYLGSYFRHFPGVWRHGDYAELTKRGGMVFYGRSDAVLNPGGIRIGTSEIYREVEKLPEILESVVVGQQWQADQRVVLFVVLYDGEELSDELQARIRQQIRTRTSPRHVPAKIIQVPDIPRTISGKIVELTVRDVIHGRTVRNTDALANPEALDHFRNLSELES